MPIYPQCSTNYPNLGSQSIQLLVVRLDPPFDPRRIRIALALSSDGFTVTRSTVRGRPAPLVIRKAAQW
jgi:hypothetical protein